MSCPAVIKVVTPGPPGPSLQITGPALAGRESGTGSLVAIPIGPGLAIVNGVLTATGGGGGGGTVTSVGLSLPGIFEVTGSPVTGAGTLTAALATQAAGLVFAGPVGGDAAAPAFRQLGYGELTGRPTLGTAAGTDASAYATAAQGAKADTAVQGVTGTGPIVSSGGTTPAISISAATASAAGSMSSADKTKLDGIQAGAEVNVNADWNASSGDAQILNKPTLGTAAAASTGDFAPAAEGVTNGNSHDHNGGDGAQIAYGSLSGVPSIPSTYSDLGPLGDGIVLVLSNRGETATAGTNYAEVPVPVPSGNFTLTAVRFGSHIDTTGSSSTTFNAYRRTAAGVKTSVLTGNATLASGASLVDVSANITGGTFTAGDRIGVDLIGVGTGAQGLFAQFLFTRSAV